MGFDIPQFQLPQLEDALLEVESEFNRCEDLDQNTRYYFYFFISSTKLLRYQFPRRNFSMNCTESYCNFVCEGDMLPNIPYAQCIDGIWKPRRANVKCKKIGKFFLFNLTQFISLTRFPNSHLNF